MCDVTKENFEELLPQIKKSIEDAAFIAVDGEFTGLSTSTVYEPALFDTPSDRYAKLKKSLVQFTLCQFGISAFLPDKSAKNRYDVHTYNFFLFPHSFGPINAIFSCQPSGIEFLTNHGFDFNMFMKSGVPYMNKDQERTLTKYHQQNSVHQNVASSLIRQIDESYVTPTLSNLDEFIKTNLNNSVHVIKTVPKGIAQYVLLKTIERRFNNISCNLQNDGTIIVKKILNVDVKFDYTAQYEKILDQAVGFTRVMRLISELKKPLVGHNMLGDLLFIYTKFFHSLPEKYSDFKKKIHQLFPYTFDTKHMAFNLKRELKLDLYDSTGLDDLYHVFSSPDGLFYKLNTPHIVHGKDFQKYDKKKIPHEAGYDAYMTGYIFLRLAHIVTSKDISSADSQPFQFHEHLDGVEDMMNCINVARAAVRYINLGCADPPTILPVRFIVTLKDQKKPISPAQVAQDFLPFGSVDVKTISRSKVLVAVSNRKRSRDVIRAFQCNKFYTVVKYDWWKHSSEAISLTMYGCAVSSAVILGGLVYIVFKRYGQT